MELHAMHDLEKLHAKFVRMFYHVFVFLGKHKKAHLPLP